MALELRLEALDDHAAYRSLDGLALSLKHAQLRFGATTPPERRYAGIVSALEEAVEAIDAVRATYREIGPLTCTAIARTEDASYRTRFAELHEYLDARPGTYDDLALTAMTLADDPRLQQQAQMDGSLGKAYAMLVRRLVGRIVSFDLPARGSPLAGLSRTGRYAAKVAVAISGLALCAAGMPLPVYLAFL